MASECTTTIKEDPPTTSVMQPMSSLSDRSNNKESSIDPSARKRRRKKKTGWDDPTTVTVTADTPDANAVMKKNEQQQPGEESSRKTTASPGLLVPPVHSDGLQPTPIINEGGFIGNIEGLSAEDRACIEVAVNYTVTEGNAFRTALNAKLKQLREETQRAYQAQLASIINASENNRALTAMSKVYVGSIGMDMGEEDVRNLFSQFGPIKSINVVADPTGQARHKGYCFVEYALPEPAALAISLVTMPTTGGRYLRMSRPNNNANVIPLITQFETEAKKIPRIFIASLHTDLSPDDVKEVFGMFGEIKKVTLPPAISSPSEKFMTSAKIRGYGYIDYKTMQAANDAVAGMSGVELGGQPLQVCRGVAPAEAVARFLESNEHVLVQRAVQDASTALALSALSKKSIFAASGAAVAPAVGQKGTGLVGAINAAAMLSNSIASSAPADESWSLDEGNAEISAKQRFLVMQKLSQGAGVGANTSSVVILRNMVGPDDIDEMLEEEVQEECLKFGQVTRVIIYQERQSSQAGDVEVKIFVSFARADGAANAIQSLNGRWFGGRQVSAAPYDEEKFNKKDFSG